MTPSRITTASRVAMAPLPRHTFGIVPSVPDATIDALHITHQVILANLHRPTTAAQALREWAEAITTVSAITEVIGYGVAEMAPHIDDLAVMTELYTLTGRVSISRELSERLYGCAELIDAIMGFAPHEVVVACAEMCEAFGPRGRR